MKLGRNSSSKPPRASYIAPGPQKQPEILKNLTNWSVFVFETKFGDFLFTKLEVCRHFQLAIYTVVTYNSSAQSRTLRNIETCQNKNNEAIKNNNRFPLQTILVCIIYYVHVYVCARVLCISLRVVTCTPAHNNMYIYIIYTHVLIAMYIYTHSMPYTHIC